MKILFIIPGLAKGGQEKMGMILTSAFLPHHEVVTVCFEPPQPYQYNYITPIIRIPNTISGNPLSKFINVIKRVIAIRKIKKSYKPELSISFGETAIIANAFTFTGEYKIASIRQSIRFITKFRSIYKLAYKLHNRIIPVSKGINEELRLVYGIYNELFIHNGYDINAIIQSSNEQLPAELHSFFNGQVIAHLGRFDLPKGHWHLVILYVLIKRKIKEAKLLLIGDYNRSNKIFKLCIDHLLNNGIKVGFLETEGNIDFKNIDVLITGHQQNPFKYLSNADIFVFPSIWEGFPGALIEAMACGLPVVSADCPTGPNEILQSLPGERNYGILMPAFKPALNMLASSLHKEWALQIISVMNDNEQKEFYRKRGISRCMDFTIEKSLEKWLKVIEQN